MNTVLKRWFPALEWARGYHRGILADDLLAAVIVTVMLIPQSLAYALLAGLPPEMGLYASILPLVAYALFGTSRTLSVGPVAVVSLMTATAIGKLVQTSGVDYVTAAIALAMVSGLFLVLMGFLRFGFLANFLSNPVVSGFISASCIVIILSQLRHLFGITAQGDNLLDLGVSLLGNIPALNATTLITGLCTLALLLWVRRGLGPVLRRFGCSDALASVIARAGPILAILATTSVSYLAGFEQRGVALVGEIPSGLPAIGIPVFDWSLWSELWVSALLISIIGFVESVSIGKTLAAKRRQRIDPNRELVALGMANVASSVSSGFPVTGGFSRSVVNFDAGAKTPVASILAAVGIALAALLLTPLFYYLPKAVLAATIIVAVATLLDFGVIRRAWRYSRSDFLAVVTTFVATLLLGVELGVLSGIVSSVALHLYKTTRPHIAVLGAVPGTETFRNVERHEVVTVSNLVSLRVDESLYFANAAYLEDFVYKLVEDNAALEHVILQCVAINEIDMSALEVLEAIDQRLAEQGIALHLSEVKGPVMDALRSVDFLSRLSGQVFLTHYHAVKALSCDENGSYVI